MIGSFYKTQATFAQKCFRSGVKTVLAGLALSASLSQNVHAKAPRTDLSVATAVTGAAPSSQFWSSSSPSDLGPPKPFPLSIAPPQATAIPTDTRNATLNYARNKSIQLLGSVESNLTHMADFLETVSLSNRIFAKVKSAGEWAYNNPFKTTLLAGNTAGLDNVR
ncbi:MAG: hypothetical protein J0G29_05755 [Alphaproteobacteria bacterium]|nr:hypothetical protein [Alphaproteobacteria bacterium]OJV45375.1 MAG: hypothetical protein BGO28_01035 [Alphaproteobacteria bacterium 43-37]